MDMVPKMTCVVCEKVAYEQDVEGYLRIVPTIGPDTADRVNAGVRIEVTLHKGEVCGVECARALFDRPAPVSVLGDQSGPTPHPSEAHPGQFL